MLQEPASRARAQRIDRHPEPAGAMLQLGNLGLYAVGHPACVEWKRNHGRIANGRPYQATHRVGEAAHWIPGGGRALAHAEPRLAVPRVLLELDRPDEDGRAQSVERVEGDVLDAGGIALTDELLAQGVAHDHPPAVLGERGNKPAFEIGRFRHAAAQLASREPRVQAVHGPALLAIERRGQQPVSVVPAFPDPR